MMSTYTQLREARRASLALGLCLIRAGRLLRWLLEIATAVAVVMPFWWVLKTLWGWLA
jgi:hypothetical protein